MYYLERFDSSEENLRAVLHRRIDKYCFENKDYNPQPAYQWVEDIIKECQNKNFVNDERFAEFKINSYLNAGKSRRYIEQKLKLKGIDNKIIDHIFENANYSEFDTALKFAKKKGVGRFRIDEQKRREYREKDLAMLVRAGFNYDVAQKILEDVD